MLAVRILTLCLICAAVVGCGKTDLGGEPSGGAGEAAAVARLEPTRLDCVGNPGALQEAEAFVQHRSGAELHQLWLLEDRPELWQTAAQRHESLVRYREQVQELLPDVGPLALIRSNRELNPWLEREYPAEGRINRLVESGVGTHRPMNCLESHLLAFQADRFPLFEQPSEIVALIAKRSEPSGDRSKRVKVYIAADDDANLPKPKWGIEAVEEELASGWTFYGVFHNHTFVHSETRGLIPVAAPSTSDLQVSEALIERDGLEVVLVSDGFSTLELTSEEVRRLSAAATAQGDSG